jgi:aspartyl-tRNA(Asn)/glutamyl-tRNA(Gln) amidotransferase subunit B
MPGALPFVNKEAVKKTIAAGLAMGCTINDVAIFERKNYFYPDLPKAYQISQLVKPICLGGGINLKSGKFIRLNRIHLEEDAGKLTHDGVKGETYIDYNRGGVPLMEMVTEPDFENAAQVVEFLEEVRSRLVYAGVAQCKMEQGGMRCDVNLSLKKKGTKILGDRTETKNLNSFKMVGRAIEFESNRQAEILANGGKIITETRKWDDAKGKTLPMRSKEQSQDYRYFPDPDIYAIELTKKDVEDIKKTMPTLAHEYREKFMTEYALPEYDADILTREKFLTGFFIDCVKSYNKPKSISNWLLTDILKYETFPNITPTHLAEIIKMVDDKKINKTVGLQLLEKVIETEKSPNELAQKLGLLSTISDAEIKKILETLHAQNPQVALDYKNRPDRVLPFIIGQVMKQTQGKAKSEVVQRLIPEVFK